MAQEYGAAQPIADVVKGAYKKVESMLGSKPEAKPTPAPAQQMNWKPTANAEQQKQIDASYQQHTAKRQARAASKGYSK